MNKTLLIGLVVLLLVGVGVMVMNTQKKSVQTPSTQTNQKIISRTQVSLVVLDGRLYLRSHYLPHQMVRWAFIPKLVATVHHRGNLFPSRLLDNSETCKELKE